MASEGTQTPSISPDERVQLNGAVPLYVKLEFNKRVEVGKRSAVLTELLCNYLGIPLPK